MNLLAGESAKAARLPLYNRLIASMRRRRPADAPRIADRWTFGRLDEAQLEAFIARLEDWYCVIPAPHGHPEDEWCYCEGSGPEDDDAG